MFATVDHCIATAERAAFWACNTKMPLGIFNCVGGQVERESGSFQEMDTLGPPQPRGLGHYNRGSVLVAALRLHSDDLNLVSVPTKG